MSARDRRSPLRMPIAAVPVLALIAGVLVPGAASSAAGPGPGVVLPDCIGKAQIRPSRVTFACADANFFARNLRWTGWGEPFAAATGTAEMNDCTPTCVAGKFRRYRMILTASGRQSCPDGRPAYTTVTYAFVGRSPLGAGSNAGDQTVSFSCMPR